MALNKTDANQTSQSLLKQGKYSAIDETEYDPDVVSIPSETGKVFSPNGNCLYRPVSVSIPSETGKVFSVMSDEFVIATVSIPSETGKVFSACERKPNEQKKSQSLLKQGKYSASNKTVGDPPGCSLNPF